MDKLSSVGNVIVGSEIIKISQQIKEIAKTKAVQNLTIGDFNPEINPIPEALRDGIIQAYQDGLTSYPLSMGELSLRKSVSTYLQKRQGITYTEDEILVGGGVRPLIYTIYKAIIDEGEVVTYPVPSWNNNHYSFLHHAVKDPIECKPENSFFPTVEDIQKSLVNSRLICLCSPQNPTGRTISPEVLKEICDAIVAENKRRIAASSKSKVCYLFFDQIYSDLSAEGTFVNPMVLCPGIKDYLICADGVSKSLCATGVRVGWIFGPKDVIGKMSEILSHIGAWAPKPEQAAVAKFLDNYDAMVDFVKGKTEIYSRIVQTICNKFQEMKDKGFRVDYQRSEGGIYISIYLDYVHSFGSTEEYISFLINRCGLGIVPFEYFGSSQNKGWFRISIGNISIENIDPVLKTIENAIVSSVAEVNSRIF